VHQPIPDSRRRFLTGMAFGTAVGFYDGFLGPGTGSFLIFGFVTIFGFDFLHASACAKVVNAATNLAALAFFVPSGLVWYELAVAMGAANILGALAGSKIALAGGVAIVRRVYLGVVSLLIVKLAYTLIAG
jgi:hypothetical protein